MGRTPCTLLMSRGWVLIDTHCTISGRVDMGTLKSCWHDLRDFVKMPPTLVPERFGIGMLLHKCIP
jgi:hypothetical protein